MGTYTHRPAPAPVAPAPTGPTGPPRTGPALWPLPCPCPAQTRAANSPQSPPRGTKNPAPPFRARRGTHTEG